jgi:hypothetical protein
MAGIVDSERRGLGVHYYLATLPQVATVSDHRKQLPIARIIPREMRG